MFSLPQWVSEVLLMSLFPLVPLWWLYGQGASGQRHRPPAGSSVDLAPPGSSGSGGGSPKVPFSILLFSLLRLKICASDDDPLAPTLTHKNL